MSAMYTGIPFMGGIGNNSVSLNSVSNNKNNSINAITKNLKIKKYTSNFSAICFCLLAPSLVTIAIYIPKSDIAIRIELIVIIASYFIRSLNNKNEKQMDFIINSDRNKVIRRLLPACLTAVVCSSLLVSNLMGTITTASGMQVKDFFTLDFLSICAIISGTLALTVSAFIFLAPQTYLINVLASVGTSLSLMFAMLFLSPLFFYKYASLFASISIGFARVVLEILLISADNLYCKNKEGETTNTVSTIKPPSSKDGTKEGKIRGKCTLIMGIFLMVSSLILPIMVNSSNKVMNNMFVFFIGFIVSVIVLSSTAAITYMVKSNISFVDIFNFSRFDKNNSIHSANQEVYYGKAQYLTLSQGIKEISKNFIVLAPQCKRRKYDVLAWAIVNEVLIILIWILAYRFALTKRWWELIVTPIIAISIANAMINYKLRPVITFFTCIGISLYSFDSGMFFNSYFFLMLMISELTTDSGSAYGNNFNTYRTLVSSVAASINIVGAISSRYVVRYAISEHNIGFSFAVYVVSIIINTIIAFSLYLTSVIPIKKDQDSYSFDTYTDIQLSNNIAGVNDNVIEEERMCIININIPGNMKILGRTKVSLLKVIFGGCNVITSKPIADSFQPVFTIDRSDNSPYKVETALMSGSLGTNFIPGKLMTFRKHKLISAFLLTLIFSLVIQMPTSYPVGIVFDCLAYICYVAIINKFNESSGRHESPVYGVLIGGVSAYSLMFALYSYLKGITALEEISKSLYMLLLFVLAITYGFSIYFAVKGFKEEKLMNNQAMYTTNQNMTVMNNNMSSSLLKENEINELKKRYITSTIIESIVLIIMIIAVMFSPLSELVTVGCLYVLGVDPATMSAGIDVGTVIASVHMAFHGTAWKVNVWYIRLISGILLGSASAFLISKAVKTETLRNTVNITSLNEKIIKFIKTMDILRDMHIFIIVGSLFTIFAYVPSVIANAAGGNISFNSINAIFTESPKLDAFVRNFIPLISSIISFIAIMMLGVFTPIIYKNGKRIKNISLIVAYSLILIMSAIIKNNAQMVIMVLFAMFALMLPTVASSVPLIIGGLFIKAFENVGLTQIALVKSEAVTVYAFMLILIILRISDISDAITELLVSAEIEKDTNNVIVGSEELSNLNNVCEPLYASFFRECKNKNEVDVIYFSTGEEMVKISMDERNSSVFNILKNMMRAISINMYIIAGFTAYLFTTWNFNPLSILLVGLLFMILPTVSAEDIKLIAQKSGAQEMNKELLLKILPIEKGKKILLFNEKSISLLLFRCIVVMSTLLFGRALYESLYYFIVLRAKYDREREDSMGLGLAIYDLVLSILIFISNIIMAIQGKYMFAGKSILKCLSKPALFMMVLSSVLTGFSVLFSKNSVVKISAFIGLVYSIIAILRTPRTSDEIRASIISTDAI